MLYPEKDNKEKGINIIILGKKELLNPVIMTIYLA